jgi:hypothetical protein
MGDEQNYLIAFDAWRLVISRINFEDEGWRIDRSFFHLYAQTKWLRERRYAPKIWRVGVPI